MFIELLQDSLFHLLDHRDLIIVHIEIFFTYFSRLLYSRRNWNC
jgi:hypothetical protein